MFSVSASGTERVVHDFEGYPKDYGRPEAGLIAVKGVLYGTTGSGGKKIKGQLCVLPYRTHDE
ncbi:MAG: hypothetical protein WBE30_14375, partial [Candidatus Cybelea sp.]